MTVREWVITKPSPPGMDSGLSGCEGRGYEVERIEQILLHDIFGHKPHVGETDTTYRLVPRILSMHGLLDLTAGRS